MIIEPTEIERTVNKLVIDEQITLSKDLLEILACPVTKAPLRLVGNRLVSTDSASKRSYGFLDGKPLLLEENATPLSEAEWVSAMIDGFKE